MKTKAKVIIISPKTGMAAAETDPGIVTVFEMLGSERITWGDELTGVLDELHTQEIYNQTRKEDLKVYIHDCGCPLHEAIERYFALLTNSAPPRRPMWPLRIRATAREPKEANSFSPNPAVA